MAALALPGNSLFSVVTLADRGRRAPAWKSLLDWPRFGDAHLDYAVDTEAQRNIWAARLDEAVLRAEKPVLLVASGASCFATAWWARLSPASYVSPVAGALLFAPFDHRAPDLADKFASPRVALPFPSAIIEGKPRRRALDASTLALAESWGSGLLDNAAGSGATAWQQAQGLVMRLTAHVVEKDMRLAGTCGIVA